MEELVKDMKPRLIGEPYKRRTSGESTTLRLYALYECQYCGNSFETMVQSIKKGHTKSCGCLKGDAHGLRSHKFYNTWKNMVDRCTSPNHKAYKNYGGRGITVCKEWLSSATFIDWCESTHPNINNYTLDRIDNDEGYSPENCTWSDKTAQVLNRRRMKNNKSGYVGVVWYIRDKKWYANIRINKILKQIGSFLTIEEAVEARDNYIIENNLPHKLSTSYK